MKSWVLNKLLWNPDQNTDSLVKVFINGFYGDAAQKIQDYYLLCKSIVKHNTYFGIYIQEKHTIYTEKFIEKALGILNEALMKAESEKIRTRVEKVYMQPLYLKCMRNKEKSCKDGTLDSLKRLMQKYNARPSERQGLDSFLTQY